MSESRGTDEDGEWAVTLEDLEADDEPERPPARPIEPGSPTVEGMVFVVLGVALTLVVLVSGL